MRRSRVMLAAGTQIGRDFKVIRLLGSGTQGEVYLVEQALTQKRRALKLFKSELSGDAGVLTRFVQEARVGALVDSQHIVDVIAAGVDEPTRRLFLAMELLEGESFDELLKRQGRLSLAEARHIFVQLGHGFGAAHRAGIVHRDIKPANIFIARVSGVGGGTLVKILDFGIAKLLDQRRGVTAGAILGTPRYMAPEQAAGGEITPRSDVWALGLLAYRALVGAPYWTGDDLAALLLDIVSAPILPASQRASQSGVVLPPGFDAWFACCVVRDPAARFPDAGTSLHALDQVFANALQADQAPPPARGVATAPKRRGALAWVLVAVAVLGLGGAVVAALSYARQGTASASSSEADDDASSATRKKKRDRDENKLKFDKPDHRVGAGYEEHETTRIVKDGATNHESQQDHKLEILAADGKTIVRARVSFSVATRTTYVGGKPQVVATPVQNKSYFVDREAGVVTVRDPQNQVVPDGERALVASAIGEMVGGPDPYLVSLPDRALAPGDSAEGLMLALLSNSHQMSDVSDVSLVLKSIEDRDDTRVGVFDLAYMVNSAPTKMPMHGTLVLRQSDCQPESYKLTGDYGYGTLTVVRTRSYF
ncbi:MAG: serine/threonine-protein kinase [Polyangiaceae bacterium]